MSQRNKRLAEERNKDHTSGVFFAGASAARLHGIGDLWADRHDFVSPVRGQSERREIRYRQRALDPRDVALVEGMPTMTIERTLADLVEDLNDLSLVADALQDASWQTRLDIERLQELLAPLAARNGFDTGDGASLLNRLLQIAGLDVDSLVRLIARSPTLGTLAQVVRQVAKVTVHDPRPTATGHGVAAAASTMNT